MKSSPIIIFLTLIGPWAFFPLSVWGIVSLHEGKEIIEGVTLLRDQSNHNAYYYVPQGPRISLSADSTLELLLLKYKSIEENEQGGIFHTLVNFTMNPEELHELQESLKQKTQNRSAYILGPVPIKTAIKDGERGMGNFEMVSAILKEIGSKESVEQEIVTKGRAPFLPGSKAAIAFRLTPTQASLLWDSFQMQSSDVSIAVHGYFEAAVPAYQATILADIEQLHQHFKGISEKELNQQGDPLEAIRKQLETQQLLEIKRISDPDVKANEDMDQILDLVAQKIMDVMFEVSSSYRQESKLELEKRNNNGDIPRQIGDMAQYLENRQGRRYLLKSYARLKALPAITQRKFFVNLRSASVINVPFHTAGNLGGVYQSDDPNRICFQEVNLNAPDFQDREVFFQVDSRFWKSFDKVLNNVTVKFRKSRAHQSSTEYTFRISKDSLNLGGDIHKISYSRIGLPDSNWREFEYKTSWNLKGGAYLEQTWDTVQHSSVILSPPFDKRVIDTYIDQSVFEKLKVKAVTISILATVNGKEKNQMSYRITPDDIDVHGQYSVFHDPDTPLYYRIIWHSELGRHSTPRVAIKEDLIFPESPKPEDFQ